MDLLTKVDGDAIGLYADLFCWLRDCRQFLAKHGDSFPTYDSDGNLTGYRPYPEVSLALKLAAQVARLESELGLTPSGRAGLHVSPSAPATVASRQRSDTSRFFDGVG
jgi:phage terminase small subunit